MEGGTPAAEGWRQYVQTGWDGMWFMPKQERPSLQADYLAVAVVTVLYPIVYAAMHKVFLEPVARKLLAGRWRSGQRLPDKLNSKINKFCESLWKMIVYATLSYLAFTTAVHEPWFGDTSYFWRGYPQHAVTAGLARLYCLQMGFYASNIGILVFWEIRRKDFWVMMVHHIVTLVLIAVSYHLNFLRVGCIILLLHDVCDVLMECAKMLKYLNQDFGGSVVFGIFMLMWILLRLIYFPFWVIWSTSVESTAILGQQVPLYNLFNGMLITLVVLHIYWFGLIVRIAYRALATGAANDIREDSDDD